MDRNEKILKLKNLKQEIKSKKFLIEKLQQEIKDLYNDIENISSISILLFLVDESLEMADPDNFRDWVYEYVYYCPDIDEVKFITSNYRNNTLPNTIDLRKNFDYIGIPKRMRTGSVESKYYREVNLAVDILKTQINYLFDAKEINSWSDLELYLENNDKPKTLK